MTATDSPGDQTVLLAAVGIHLALTLAHGVAHAAIPVRVTDWQAAYSVVVLLGAPLCAGALALADRLRLAAWLLLVAGVAGLAFEAGFHYVVVSPDNVAVVERSATAFGATAGLSTLGGALAVAAATFVLARQAQGSSATSAIDSTT